MFFVFNAFTSFILLHTFFYENWDFVVIAQSDKSIVG